MIGSVRNAPLGGIADVAERTWDFWAGALTGQGLNVDSPPATYEQVKGERYNVAQTVKDYQKAWLGVTPNHVTPIDVLDLLFFLDEFTLALEQEDIRRRMPAAGPQIPRDCDNMAFDAANPGYRQSCVDLQRWRKRLDGYIDFVSSVPIEQENDRGAILWEVTAPLLVGWYGGPTGDEIPLDPEAYPPGFDPFIRHPVDIATPYMLANQFGIWVAWQDERKRRLIHDTMDPFKPTQSDWWLLAAAGAVVVGGYALLHRK